MRFLLEEVLPEKNFILKIFQLSTVMVLLIKIQWDRGYIIFYLAFWNKISFKSLDAAFNEFL